MWFSASLLFKSVRIDESPKEALFEERIILINAALGAEAQAEAEAIGKGEEHEYMAADGYLIRWVFQGVERIHAIQAETLENGTEVFSRFITSEDAERAVKLFEGKR